MVCGGSPTLLFYLWIPSCPTLFVEKSILSLNYLGTFAEIQLIINVRVYFWAHHSFCIYIYTFSLCYYHAVLITKALQ